MARPGALRLELLDTLTAAHGRGLLSENTFAARVDTLLGGGVLDPQGLVGDIYLRDSRTGLRERLGQTLSALTGHLESLFDRATPPVRLLALAWDGTQAELTVGRSLFCDVVLDDLSVSRRHAQLSCREGSWSLKDTDSRNGTWLNGRAVVRCELRAGDLLALGDQLLRVD